MFYLVAIIAAVLLYGAAVVRSAIAGLLGLALLVALGAYFFRDNLAVLMLAFAVFLLVAYGAMRIFGIDPEKD